MPRTIESYLIASVLVHLVVVLVHSGSHVILAILPPLVDSAFIAVVIVAGPPVSLLLLRDRRLTALVLIAILMGGGFLYGFNGHFYAEGADRVALNLAEWPTTLFVGTAGALGVLEAMSLALALAAIPSSRRPSPSGTDPADSAA